MSQFRLITGFFVFALLSGCAHVPSKTQNTELGALGAVPSEQDSEEGSAEGTIVMENGQISVRGMKLNNSKFDYPVTINSRVEFWVDYFTGRGRPHFAKYLERSEFFIPYIRPLLNQSGLPEDLVYLAMIESGFNNHARSHAKAVGAWQFISATGKRYGLAVNWWVDERRDVRKSTLAAIAYLKDLYDMFQSWELAAAAYNAGEAKVARAIRRYGTRDFWALARQRFFRPETRDYVPKIIAAAIIAKNPAQFGFPVPKSHPGQDEALAGDGEIVKVIKTDKPEEQIPPEEIEEAETVAAIIEKEESPENEPEAEPTPAMLTVTSTGADQPLAKPVPTPHVTKTGEVGGEQLVEFDVKGPADLLKVARAAGLSYQTVKSLNPEILRWCTPPNMATYRIKLPASVKESFLETYNHAAFPRQVSFLTYKVRQGETLSRIAHRFGIRVDPIADLNRVSPRAPLRRGSKVILPLPTDRTRSLATLDVRDPPERRKKRSYRPRTPKYKKISYKAREEARSRGARSPQSTNDT